MEDDQVLDAIKKLDAHRLHEEPHEENTMKYPEEIYQNFNGVPLSNNARDLGGAGWGRRHAYRLGYEAVRDEKADPLEVYSNLTAAISAGDPIDWGKLDGLKTQCVNPELRGELHGTLKRDPNCPIDRPVGWFGAGMDGAYISALRDAWDGVNGWTLWVEGDIPMRRKTADQLPVTTFFKGRRGGTNGAGSFMCVGEAKNGKFILSAIDFLISSVSAEEWEVLEEYGTFQKPEGK